MGWDGQGRAGEDMGRDASFGNLRFEIDGL